MRYPFALSAIAATGVAIAACTATPAATKVANPLVAAVSAPTRTPANVARDKYRHPAETLAFFGVKPTDKVVEVWPAGGWYTEILAPYLAKNGAYIAASPAGERGKAGIVKLMAANAAAYGKIQLASFPSTDGVGKVADGSADVVLTFRNVHNWSFGATDLTQTAFDQMFAMLKPGGTLGLVEHHLPEAMAATTEAKSGYMKKSSVVRFAEKAGFKLAGESAVNANPKDTHDYPRGVWTLPPSFAAGETDRARYAAIGESDRMTLKFVKPK
ncbi:MAG: class I SAM-dependent methyltransferase [Sphingomonas sp.]